MPSEDPDRGHSYCIHCGEEIPSDPTFCPECGSEQVLDGQSTNRTDGQSEASETEHADNDGFTSWAIGFAPGEPLRNIAVGVGYFVFYFVGIPVILYSYWSRGDKYKTRTYAVIGVVLLSVFAVGILGAVVGPVDETGSPEDPSTTSSVEPRIGAIDVDVQIDIGQNNIGFDVETVFEDTATLTVTVSDGEASAQRSFEGTTTTGTSQEFNDDIDPPDTFRDDERFTATFTLSVDGEVADEKQVTHVYSE